MSEKAEQIVLYNGELVQYKAVPAYELERAWKYGDGVFETIRIRNKTPLFLQRHFQRLGKGMEHLGLKSVSLKNQLAERLPLLINAHSEPENAKIRVQVFRTGGGAFFPQQDLAGSLIELTPMNEDPYQSFQPVRIKSISSPLPESSRIKSSNSLVYILAIKEARDSGFDEALILNDKDEVAEATSSNIFFLQGNQIVTPTLTTGCLPGIMRAEIISFCNRLGLKCEEKLISRKELGSFEEAFTTNVINGIVPVQSIDEHTFETSEHSSTSILRQHLLRQLERTSL